MAGTELQELDKLLPEEDVRFLREKDYGLNVVEEGGWLLAIFRGFELPEAYEPRSVDLLIRLPPGYPDVSPDMFWTRPVVRLRSGSMPQRAEHNETHGGASWQRWSRHFARGNWRPGIDSLRTYMAALQRELARGR